MALTQVELQTMRTLIEALPRIARALEQIAAVLEREESR